MNTYSFGTAELARIMGGMSLKPVARLMRQTAERPRRLFLSGCGLADGSRSCDLLGAANGRMGSV